MSKVYLVRVKYGDYEDYNEETLMVLSSEECAEKIRNMLIDVMSEYKKTIKKWRDNNPEDAVSDWDDYYKRIGRIYTKYKNKINKIIPKEYHIPKDRFAPFAPFYDEIPNFFIESHNVY